MIQQILLVSPGFLEVQLFASLSFRSSPAGSSLLMTGFGRYRSRSEEEAERVQPLSRFPV